MSRTLSIANKLLSLRGRMTVVDESGATAFEAHGTWSFFVKRWLIEQNGKTVLSLRRKIFALRTTWLVSGELGEFRLRRKWLAFTRQYVAIGGPFDGAQIKGNVLGLKFSVTHGKRPLATVRTKLLTLRERQTIDVEDDAVAFVVAAIVVMRLDRHDEQEQDE